MKLSQSLQVIDTRPLSQFTSERCWRQTFAIYDPFSETESLQTHPPDKRAHSDEVLESATGITRHFIEVKKLKLLNRLRSRNFSLVILSAVIYFPLYWKSEMRVISTIRDKLTPVCVLPDSERVGWIAVITVNYRKLWIGCYKPKRQDLLIFMMKYKALMTMRALFRSRKRIEFHGQDISRKYMLVVISKLPRFVYKRKKIAKILW